MCVQIIARNKMPSPTFLPQVPPLEEEINKVIKFHFIKVNKVI